MMNDIIHNFKQGGSVKELARYYNQCVALDSTLTHLDFHFSVFFFSITPKAWKQLVKPWTQGSPKQDAEPNDGEKEDWPEILMGDMSADRKLNGALLQLKLKTK